MLSRPEIGTRAHIKLWVAGKDPEEVYVWTNSRDCACGQYCREHINADYNWMNDPQLAPAIHELDLLAGSTVGRTFGCLHAQLVANGW